MAPGSVVEASGGLQHLPEGIVTFLFSDIQGSTALLQRLGDAYADVLMTHHRLVRACLAAHQGHEVDTEGDAFFVAFASPRAAVAAAVAVQRALQTHPWPHGDPVLVRMGLHAGEPMLVGDKYVGMDVHRAARVCSAAHGGQVLVSDRVRDLAGAPPDGVGYVDLGEHRLKDLPEPQRLFQLRVEGLPDRFPPLRSLSPPTNLPERATALVGRGPAVGHVAEVLAAGARLVTVTGPGGVGKTRLAAAVARGRLVDYPYGAHFVDLSAVHDGADVAGKVVRAADVPLEADETPLAALARHLGGRRALLVLDNVEQIAGAAAAVAALLQACAGLRLLVTSRTVLGLHDEHEYALAPLAAADAVELFVQRARMARHDFVLTAANTWAVERVCALLDCLPLAIELAAARIRIFTPDALVSRLDDRLSLLTGGGHDAPERHRALSAAIDWSYDLLDEAERRFFLAMTVFRGGTDLAGVEAVSDPGCDVLELLTSLVRHSLVRQREDADGQPRFTMLATLHEYAAVKLREDGDRWRKLHERHARHVLDLVERAHGVRFGQHSDYAGLHAEHDNIREALRFWLGDRTPGAVRDADRALRLSVAMASYWYQHGMAAEGLDWLGFAVAADEDAAPALRADGLRWIGVLTEARRDFPGAERVLREALGLYRELGDRHGEARSLNSLGVVALSLHELDAAEDSLREAAAIRSETGDERGLTATRNNLGIVLLEQARWGEAKELFADNLLRDREVGDDWGAACTCLNMAVAHLCDGGLEQATPLVAEAIGAFLEVEDPDGALEGLEAAVGVALQRGRPEVALRVAGAAAGARHRLDLPGATAGRSHLEGWLAAARSQLSQSVADAAWREGEAMTYEQAAAYVLQDVTAPPPGDRRERGQHVSRR